MKKSIMFLAVAAGLLLAVSTSRLLAVDAASKEVTITPGAVTNFTGSYVAADDSSKEVTITGNMVCAKCTLHETDKCQNVVQVVKDGKNVNYYLKQNDVSKAAHDPICGGSSEKVTVTGTVTEKDGKEMMTPTKIDVVKS